MRADRLLELLLRLQMRGGAPASELAVALEVSVRTVYRDVEALSAAGVPVWTETGRGGGIRIDPSYRVGGLPRVDTAEARSLMFAAVPAIAARLGLDDVAERSLLPALERSSEGAARVVRDRLLVEPEHWFDDAGEEPHLASLAEAVWGSRALRLVYRGNRLVVHPLGLVLRGSTWYLVGRCRLDDGRGTRLFRVSRVDEATVLDQVLTPPADFDLTSTWRALREEFRAGLPRLEVTVRVAPDAEPVLGVLEEASPSLPLPADVRRDGEGWALLDLVFERGPAGAARKLLQLGAGIEVVRPTSVRALMVEEAERLASLYARQRRTASMTSLPRAFSRSRAR